MVEINNAYHIAPYVFPPLRLRKWNAYKPCYWWLQSIMLNEKGNITCYRPCVILVGILLVNISNIIKKITICNFSHITFLMSHITCLNLNNTHKYSYNLLSNELKKITPNMFIAKLCIFNKCLILCLWPSNLWVNRIFAKWPSTMLTFYLI